METKRARAASMNNSRFKNTYYLLFKIDWQWLEFYQYFRRSHKTLTEIGKQILPKSAEIVK